MKKTYILMMLITLLFSSPFYLNADNTKTDKSAKGLPIPYTCKFETKEVFNTWTIIDANTDKKTWLYPATAVPTTARCAYSNLKDSDDWLISPSITLEAGKKYRLKFDIYSRQGVQSLKVFYGKGATVEAQQVNQLADYPKMPNNGYIPQSIMLSPTETGDYNMGFYSYSQRGGYFSDVTNVVVELMEGFDLQAISLQGQVMPKLNKEYSYTVKIKNNGSITQSEYKVQLVDGAGNVLATTDVKEDIAAYEVTEKIVKWTPITTTGAIAVKAKVVLVGDMLATNDETPAINIDVQPDQADEWTAIGNGTLLESSPIDFYFQTSASQTIYLKDEIGFAGMIKKIIYSYSNNSKFRLINHPIKIYMASTELTDMSGGVDTRI